MNQGYHQYGIEWDAHPVNLGPMREETKRIVAEEDAKRQARMAANSNLMQAPTPQLSAETKAAPQLWAARETNAPAVTVVAAATPAKAEQRNPLWLILAVLGVLLASFLIKRFVLRRSSDA
jgi:hypothetical protein